MAQTVFHQAQTRGAANHGWLKSYHSFSFAGYYNPERINFGALRVLNDDTVSGGMGFGEHPHDNMEIISIPLAGKLEHKDSIGNTTIIEAGEIQVMSAGTGIYHSERNADEDATVKFLQIWLFPNQRNVSPRYDQKKINNLNKPNELVQILSPNANADGVWIYQDAWFNFGTFDQETTKTYQLHKKQNGVYVFIIAGNLEINGQALATRDGFGIWETESFDLKIGAGTTVLVMEVPMEIE